MKQNWVKIFTVILITGLFIPGTLLAQKEEKVKDVKEKKDVEQIIITRKGDDKAKVVIEINGDNVTINGKALDEYKDPDGTVSIKRSRYRDYEGLVNMARVPKGDVWNFESKDGHSLFKTDANHAMLGVTTEESEGGVKINDITKESAAAKIGLKEGDVITKIGSKKIDSPDGLSKAIREHKPGDKVTVTYLRDQKEQTATAELTQWKNQNFNMDMGNMNFDKVMPKLQSLPRIYSPYGQNGNRSGTPKLGLSVQDTDDGKGVKVIEVDDESNAAKAGIKEEDVLTEVDGKAVNSTDDMVKVIKESKEKISVMFKLQRAGKTQNIEVKIPRKIKTADL